MGLQQLIQEYLATNTHMQLATSADGQPWLCTVYFVADDDFTVYWMSNRSRRHSKEILNNAQTAVTVVRDTERKQALQIIGTAHEVNDNDIARVDSLYNAKFGPKNYDLDEIKRHAPDGRAYWVFKPSTIYIWDEVNFLTHQSSAMRSAS